MIGRPENHLKRGEGNPHLSFFFKNWNKYKVLNLLF